MEASRSGLATDGGEGVRRSGRWLSVLDLTARYINNELGSLAKVAGTLHVGKGFRHRDASDEE